MVLEQKMKSTEVARSLGLSTTTLFPWLYQYRESAPIEKLAQVSRSAQDRRVKEFVGWSMPDSLTLPLAFQAPDRAVNRQKPAPGLVHHSERGIQYLETKAYAKSSVFEWFEVSYHRPRIYSAINFTSPECYERRAA